MTRQAKDVMRTIFWYGVAEVEQRAPNGDIVLCDSVAQGWARRMKARMAYRTAVKLGIIHAADVPHFYTKRTLKVLESIKYGEGAFFREPCPVRLEYESLATRRLIYRLIKLGLVQKRKRWAFMGDVELTRAGADALYGGV